MVVDGGIKELTDWIRANQHQSLELIISSCLQRGYSKRVINAAIQAYLVTATVNPNGEQGTN